MANNRIDDLVENFKKYIDYYYDNEKFSGPSVYFHCKVLEMIRNTKTVEEYSKLLDNDQFLERIYATLTAWGMHRMGPKGAKMCDFKPFCESIRSQKGNLIRLYGYKLSIISESELNKIKSIIEDIFNGIRISPPEIKAKIVGNSKILHHLLPDLMPPIDREHTLKFFERHITIKNQTELFWEIFVKFFTISKRLNLKEDDWKNGRHFDTSIPKLIDNAIIGYVIST
jgi:hypothetical protein